MLANDVLATGWVSIMVSRKKGLGRGSTTGSRSRGGRYGRFAPKSRAGNDPEQVFHLAVSLNRVTQRLVRQNPVLIAAANALSLDKARLFQIVHNPLHGAFRNPDAGRHLA